jgi:hypothetical protein
MKQLPRDLDIGFSDASYHETYSAEFGASGLTVPDDDAADERAGPGLFEARDEGADSFVVRPSAEADPFALLGFGSRNESSDFDVTAFEASTVPASHGDPVTGSEAPAPDHPGPVAKWRPRAARGTTTRRRVPSPRLPLQSRSRMRPCKPDR